MEKLIERYNITHIYISKSLKSNNFFNNFNLIDYKNENKNENTLFFGVYGLNDYKKINNHIGKKIIFWGGNDANTNNFKRLKLMKIIKNATHIADTEIIYKNLIKVYDDDKIEITYKSNHNKSIINYKSINYLKNIVDKSEKIIILSKGNNYDFSQDEPEDTHLYVGIKQSIMNLPRKDILIMNDFNSVFGIENVISEIKIILCPDLIHLYEKPNKKANHFLEDYLKLHNFNGVIINYQIPSNNNINNELFRYSKPIFDTGEVIFAILEHIGTENKFINIYGLYESFNDNFKITTSIKNAIVPLNYKIFYDDYIKIIHNKINKNKNNMRIQNESVLVKKREYIYKRNKDFFNKNLIKWNKKLFYKKIYVLLEERAGYTKILKKIFNFKYELDIEVLLFNKNTDFSRFIDKNCIYLFIKHYVTPNNKIIKFMSSIFKENYIIFQTLDANWTMNLDEYKKYQFNYVDSLIFNSKYNLNLYNVKNNYFLYHCYDKEFLNLVDKNADNNTKIVYGGDLKKSSLTLEILDKFNITHISSSRNNNIHKEYLHKCIYIDYCLPNHTYFNYHTSTKLANALLLNSIFICNEIPIYKELLGNDYKFYINDDLSNFNLKIQEARNILNDDSKYNMYLNKYQHVKESLSYSSMINNYKNIFDDIKSASNENNYNKLYDYVKSKKKITILGKGSDQSKFIDKNDDTLYVGIKQSILSLHNKDILIMNDFEGLFGLEDIICEIKFIICPLVIHYKHTKNSKEGNLKFMKYLKLHNFKGEIVRFYKGQISNNDDYSKYFQIKGIKDSSEVIFLFLNEFYVKNKLINIYGLYEDFNDNKFVQNKIKNADVNYEFKDDHISYLERVINNKKEQNINHFNKQNESNLNQILLNKKKYTCDKFTYIFNNNNINWSSDNDEYVFYILRHVNSELTNKYWYHTYLSIRKFYKFNKIIIIDDGSDKNYLTEYNLMNTTIYFNEFSCSGEILPYIYFLNSNYKKMIFLHDSNFILKYINFSNYDNKIFFESKKHQYNEDEYILKILNNLKNNENLVKLFYDNKNWSIACGATSVITRDFLAKACEKYDLLNKSKNLIITRGNRMCWERIIGLLISDHNNKINEDISIFGDIYKYFGKFNHYKKPVSKKKSFEEYINHIIELDYYYLFKVWTGR